MGKERQQLEMLVSLKNHPGFEILREKLGRKVEAHKTVLSLLDSNLISRVAEEQGRIRALLSVCSFLDNLEEELEEKMQMGVK